MTKSEGNIFGFAGKQPEKGKKKPHELPSTTPPKSLPFKGSTGDPEIDRMLNRLREMDQDLQNKMQRICELTGMTKNEIQRFIENPNNFTDAQWRKAQLDKEKLEQKIYAAIGMEAKKRVQKKKKLKLAKERKGKTLGGRKGWIQM